MVGKQMGKCPKLNVIEPYNVQMEKQNSDKYFGGVLKSEQGAACCEHL